MALTEVAPILHPHRCAKSLPLFAQILVKTGPCGSDILSTAPATNVAKQRTCQRNPRFQSTDTIKSTTAWPSRGGGLRQRPSDGAGTIRSGVPVTHRWVEDLPEQMPQPSLKGHPHMDLFFEVVIIPDRANIVRRS